MLELDNSVKILKSIALLVLLSACSPRSGTVVDDPFETIIQLCRAVELVTVRHVH